ncbi:MAG: polyprenyl synthetase family protein [Thermoanaerobaculia bacterium]
MAPIRLALLPQDEFEYLRAALRDLVDLPYGIERRLRAAVAATLATPGSLWRAQLAWASARASGLDERSTLGLACAVESFHVASLLFDDLPAMDDALTRRDRPCVHRVHGEAAAILAALAFVHEGHARLSQALDFASPDARREARALWVECLGLRGILDGQARDLAPQERVANREEVLRQAAGKSVPLLRLALELPAVVAGVAAGTRSALRRLSEHLGLAYQLLDDIADEATIDAASGLANARRTLGAGATARLVRLELGRAREAAGEIARELPLLVPVLEATVDRLDGSLADVA